MLQTILFVFIVLGIWGIALRALDDTYSFIINPILNAIVGPNKKNRLIYYPFCYIFMTFHRLVTLAPLWAIMVPVLWFISFSDKYAYLGGDNVYLIPAAICLVAGFFKMIERSKKDYYDVNKDPYSKLSVDELIEECRKTRAAHDRLFRFDP